jgi:hypothetical protein
MYHETKGIWFDVYGSTMECIGISMAFRIPLLVIDRREVSIKSVVLLTRRLAQLKIYIALRD